MRQPNAIDFWRGFALISIFINHIPGNAFERITHRNFSLSDSAELFVFLAGWSLRYAARGSGGKAPSPAALVLRLTGRSFQIHGAQFLISLLALALLAAAALGYQDPLILSWHHAEAFFQAPAPTLIGLALLLHQLGYFNILPLYVVLMHAAAPIALLDRLGSWQLFGVSLGIYAATLISEVNVPSWPVEGRWFLNPLAWQFLFVLGFLAADPRRGIGRFAHEHMRWLIVPAVVVVIASAIATIGRFEPNPLAMPQPRLFFTFNKTFLSPARLIAFLSLAIVFASAFPYIFKAAPAVSRYACMLGRQSLPVFCVGSLLSLLGQLVHYVAGSGFFVDIVVISIGLFGLGLTAWLSEWRDQLGVS